MNPVIKCHLTLPPLTGTTYDPPNKNMFSPGETLRVTCGEQHWILDTRTRWTNVTCSDNGAWNKDPVCQEVICPAYIQEEHYTVNTWGRNKLGDRATYRCDRDYQATQAYETATCTRDGWGPKPLCRGTRCGQPNIENIRITRNDKKSYSHHEQLTYECVGGTPNTVTITCVEGTWQGIKQCSGERPCVKPDFTNGFTVSVSEDTLYYSCNENYKLPTKNWWGQAKCKDGVWDGLQTCIEKGMCGEAPVISNGRVIVEERSFKIECNEGYIGETDGLTCQNGRWSFGEFTAKTICRATAEHCSPPPRVENAIVTVSYQKEYLADSSVTYQCREKYILEKEATIACQAGEWETKNIKCIRIDSRLTFEHMVKERYMEGEVIAYVCTAPGANAKGNAT
ncbi:hypothetical protein XENOCAPTIV_020107, partial [Xenoophorus captivus]